MPLRSCDLVVCVAVGRVRSGRVYSDIPKRPFFRLLLPLSSNFVNYIKYRKTVRLKPKSEEGIEFGDDFVWENGPSEWFSRVTLFESYRRLYSNATTSNVPPGVAKYILGHPFEESIDPTLEVRSMLVSRARQCNNGSPGCCCVCSRTDGDNKSNTQYCANVYGGTPQRCGCGNGKNCIQGVTQGNTYQVAYCSTSSPSNACFQCTGGGCSCG